MRRPRARAAISVRLAAVAAATLAAGTLSHVASSRCEALAGRLEERSRAVDGLVERSIALARFEADDGPRLEAAVESAVRAIPEEAEPSALRSLLLEIAADEGVSLFRCTSGDPVLWTPPPPPPPPATATGALQGLATGPSPNDASETGRAVALALPFECAGVGPYLACARFLARALGGERLLSPTRFAWARLARPGGTEESQERPFPLFSGLPAPPAGASRDPEDHVFGLSGVAFARLPRSGGDSSSGVR